MGSQISQVHMADQYYFYGYAVEKLHSPSGGGFIALLLIVLSCPPDKLIYKSEQLP